ncbi:MAG: multidrug ABC transporter ATP-binding protein [Gammaproteobacteria bacterium]|nr:MAG: multidrug ABC transporter ATP-binding protein [Gammaproteobacteria bacterium]
MNERIFQWFEALVDPLAERAAERAAVRPPPETVRFFRFYLEPIRGVLILTLVVFLVATLADMAIYLFMGRILDWMRETPPEHFLAEHGWSLFGMFVIVGIVRPVATLTSRALLTLAIAPGLTNAVRWHNHRYLLRQGIDFFTNDFSGRIAQKVLQTGRALRDAMTNVLEGIWMLVVYLIGIVLLFAAMHPIMMIPVLIWVGFYLLVIRVQVPPVRQRSEALSEATSKLTGRIVDTYTNIQSVLLFARHDREANYAAEGIARHTAANHALVRRVLSMVTSLTVINTMLIVSVAALSIWLWSENRISVGEIAVVNSLVIRVNHMSGWILRSIANLFENIGSVENGIKLVSRPLAVTDREDAGRLAVSDGRIRFDAVSFGYGAAVNGTDVVPAHVIRNCSFTIEPGERVGLVGRSGAGKSTLVSLLLRFHDVDAGAVTIDGQDVREVTQQSLRRQIAVVSQDTSLLHRPIRENIAYGASDASESDILHAAERARVTEFLPDLVDPQGRKGLDAFVGERGVKLSGGQRQRIAIARVFVKNAPLLVLDEATSALDSEIEHEIQASLLELMEGKTVLAIAHRLSTLKAMDRLLVIDAGEIVESGSHQELLDAGGIYAALWQRQTGGFV